MSGISEEIRARSAKPDLTILAIDTSSSHGSIAITRGNRAMALFGADSQDTHSTRLIGEIDMILTRTGIKLEDVDAFAAVTGPGSFTGLRIGLSTVKGLARATGKPVVGVTTLEATALNAGVAGEVLAFINALRQEVYAQLFQVTDAGETLPLTSPMVA